MRLLSAALGILLLANSALALEVITPPRQYDRPHPNLIILEVPRSQVSQLCRQLFGRNFSRSGELNACAAVGDGASSCIVVLPAIGEGGIFRGNRAALLRHEQAHCNGWSGSHPNR
jgi:hypothetical protein